MSSSVKNSKTIALSFVLNGKVTLLTLVLLPLLVSLGFWQLERAAEKRNIQQQYNARQVQAPIEIGEGNYEPYLPYTRVIVQGEFDHDRSWLLDNQQRKGRPGFDVLQPFKVKGGAVILVNRGWLAGRQYRSDLPVIEKVAGEVTIFAQVMEPTHHPMLSAVSESLLWPKIISGIELEVMAGQLEAALAVQYLRLDEASAGALDTRWHIVAVSEAKHLGYAVQWFAMALALMACYVLINTNLIAWFKNKFK